MKTFLILVLFITSGCSDYFIKETSPQELPRDAFVLDVRTRQEHQEIALDQTHFHRPLDQLDAKLFIQEYQLVSDRPLYLLCRSGKRAKEAARMFKRAGFNNVIVIRGGLIAAEKAGLKVKRHPQIFVKFFENFDYFN